MNTRTTTNILLALIAGLLIALVASPVSNSAPKSYDQVKLVEYQACLLVNGQSEENGIPRRNIGLDERLRDDESLLQACRALRPR